MLRPAAVGKNDLPRVTPARYVTPDVYAKLGIILNSPAEEQKPLAYSLPVVPLLSMSSHQATATIERPQGIAPPSLGSVLPSESFTRCIYCHSDLHPPQTAYCAPWCQKEGARETRRLTALQKRLSNHPLTNHVLTLHRSTVRAVERYQRANLTHLRARAQQLEMKPEGLSESSWHICRAMVKDRIKKLEQATPAAGARGQ